MLSGLAMAEYLDNDENGAVDNTAVVNAMKATLLLLRQRGLLKLSIFYLLALYTI